MGLDDTINLERLASAFEKIAAAMEESNKIERERLTREFPEQRQLKPGEVIRTTDEERKELLSDKPSDDWLRETEAALPQSRFSKRFDEAQQSKNSKPASGSPQKVSKTQ